MLKSQNKTCDSFSCCYLTFMTETTYPSTPEEFEEYRAVMEQMADEAEASAPDATPLAYATYLAFGNSLALVSGTWEGFPVLSL